MRAAPVLGAVLAGCGGAAEPRPVTPASPVDAGAVVDAGCSSGGRDAVKGSRRQDARLGRLVLLGGRRWPRQAPNAFADQGYKIPVTLPAGKVATLTVAASMRGRVGLVFTHEAQSRVERRGVRGADQAVRFTSCPGSGPTGWPGGIVVDRPRCAVLVATAPGLPPVRRRLPLGRRCP